MSSSWEEEEEEEVEVEARLPSAFRAATSDAAGGGLSPRTGGPRGVVGDGGVAGGAVFSSAVVAGAVSSSGAALTAWLPPAVPSAEVAALAALALASTSIAASSSPRSSSTCLAVKLAISKSSKRKNKDFELKRCFFFVTIQKRFNQSPVIDSQDLGC
jgi:hypothetical protein